MGIKGLQTFLNPYEAELFGPPQSLASQLDGKILLVDFAGKITSMHSLPYICLMLSDGHQH